MKRFTKIMPPNPADYHGNHLSWQRAMYDWAMKTGDLLEKASTENDTPLQQPFVVGTFTSTVTSIAGTTGSADAVNFLCGFVQAFINKGIVRSKEVSDT